MLYQLNIQYPTVKAEDSQETKTEEKPSDTGGEKAAQATPSDTGGEKTKQATPSETSEEKTDKPKVEMTKATMSLATSGEKTDTATVEIKGKSYSISLDGFDTHLQMFEPNRLTAFINVSPVPDLDDLQQFLESWVVESFQIGTPKKSTVTTSTDGGEKTSDPLTSTLCEQFICYNVSVIYKYDNTGSINVEVEYCSPDIMLTQKAFCRAYTGKRFGKEIFMGSIQEVDLPLELRQCNLASDPIVPYLVQYNESLYDFFRRTAYRTGEFLYFSQGKLQLGLLGKTDKAETLDASQLRYVRFPKRKSASQEVKATTKTYQEKKTYIVDDKPQLGEGYMYHNPLNTDEYHKSMMSGDKFVSPLAPDAVSFKSVDPRDWSSVKAVLGKTSLGSAMAKIADDMALDAATTAFIEPKLNEEYSDEFKDKEYLYSEKETLSGSAYYQIEEKERASLAGVVEIQTGSADVKMALGQQVTININGSETSKYLIADIKIVQKKGQDLVSSLLLIPVNADDQFYPVYRPNLSVRRSEPQIGFVAAADDPSALGRVRVRFNWQNAAANTESGTKTELDHDLLIESNRNYTGDGEALGNDITPWIRVSTPSATAGSNGFYFSPRVGDEVLVSFLDGNIEHPYVSGSLYSAGRKPKVSKDSDTSHCDNGSFYISGSHGHYLKFTEENDGSSFIGGFQGALGSILQWAPISVPETTAGLSGAIAMGDKQGITTIKLSSSDRSISVASPLGDVKLSAFSGISIKAPNGDISIEGQNVEIKAGNNLTLVSGANIKPKGSTATLTNFLQETVLKFADQVPTIFGGAELSAWLDVCLVRTVVETFIRPIGGTLSIKSNMNVQIVYGGGKPKKPKEFLKKVSGKIKDDLVGSICDWHEDRTEEKIYDSKVYDQATLTIVNHKAKYKLANGRGADDNAALVSDCDIPDGATARAFYNDKGYSETANVNPVDNWFKVGLPTAATTTAAGGGGGGGGGSTGSIIVGGTTTTTTSPTTTTTTTSPTTTTTTTSPTTTTTTTSP